VIVHGLDDDERRAAYACDITYGTNNELRLRLSARQHEVRAGADGAARPFNFAIVDEVDSILIDEARTPLIISGPTEDRPSSTSTIDALIPQLRRATTRRTRSSATATLHRSGTEKIENGCCASAGLLQGRNLYDVENVAIVHHVNQALRAHKLFQRDKDYIVKDGEVVIIDEFTGRMMPAAAMVGRPAPGARSQGRRQDPAREPDARLDHLPELFPHVRQAGRHDRHGRDRSGGIRRHLQARTSSTIPTNVPVQRIDDDDEVYRTARRSSRRSRRRSASAAKGQPVLVGTVSIEKSEMLSECCARQGMSTGAERPLPRAGSHIVAQAGVPGAVTIATNMAGRGTDIQLGGNL
jgi:preprotein translocase subunit SecA